MRIKQRLLFGIILVAFLLISWLVTLSTRTPLERQTELLTQAELLIADGIYILAVPLLEEAASYNTKLTLHIESELKKVYLALIDTRGFHNKYLTLLERQMSRSDAQSDVFIETATYLIALSRTGEALNILKAGISHTGCELLKEIYEQNRYHFEINRAVYDYASPIYNGMSMVKRNDLWGISRADGFTLIPCEYDKISTFSNGRAIVMKGGEVYAVNRDNNRVALLREDVYDFGNLSNNRIPLLFYNGWRRSDSSFNIGSQTYQEIGMASDGYAAVKLNDRWGVIDQNANWLLHPNYCGIIMDELGRSYARGAVFATLNSRVYLYINGIRQEGYYQNARPFSAEGYAAVMRNGVWGYINLDGTVAIDFQFDDALSFGQHLAAVKVDNMWGYINLYGEVVIEPQFYDAKSFSQGHSPILTARGWQFITLIEFKRGIS